MKLFAHIAACACVASTGVLAETAPPRQIVCATIEAMDCETGSTCVKGHPSEIGAPVFMRIDLEKKTVAGPERTTPIQFIESNPDSPQMLLQGTETGFGWTLALDTKAGTMAGTLVNREGAFVLFGSCMPL
jgi:hypothetical protein